MSITDILSDISAFSNPFGAPAQGQWNLSKGSYVNSVNVETIFFFEAPQGQTGALKNAIDQTTDGGGRRVAIYEYPYIDGQKTDDLGRKGGTFTFNIKFYGLNYQSALTSFIRNVVNDPGPGKLLHPTLSPLLGKAPGGAIPARFRDYEFVHRYDEWNAVTIKATFVEDNTSAINVQNQAPAKPDSALRSALQTLMNTQSTISSSIFLIGALQKLPGAIVNGLKTRLTTITKAYSKLLGQLGATFSSNSLATFLSAQSTNTGGVTGLTSGTVPTTATTTVPTTGVTASALYALPPVYQVGFDPVTQAGIQNQQDSFVNSNQITPQQAVYSANQIRALIAIAINEVSGTENAVNISTVTNEPIIGPNGVGILGNNGYSIMLQYRALAVSLQQVVEQCISTAQTQVTLYTVPFPMSLRTIAVLNGLTPDDQNAIQALNPFIQCINYVSRGTIITVPAT